MKLSIRKITVILIATVLISFFFHLVFLPWELPDGRVSINVGHMIARVATIPFEVIEEIIGLNYPSKYNFYLGLTFASCIIYFLTWIITGVICKIWQVIK